MQKFNEGDRVKFAASWLRGIKAAATDDLWRAEGTVQRIKSVAGKTIVVVLWSGEEETRSSMQQCLTLARIQDA
jgi:hypothetical protein